MKQHTQPNLLFIFSDQQHWRALGCEDPFFDTPHLDAFAARGIQLIRHANRQGNPQHET